MKKKLSNRWCAAQNIYRNIIYCGLASTLLVLALCIVCGHSSLVVAIFSMCFAFVSIYVTLKLNESVTVQGFRAQYADDEILDSIRQIAEVGRTWKHPPKDKSMICPIFNHRSPDNNPDGRIVIENEDKIVLEDKRNLPWSKQQDRARRKLVNYFREAYRLRLVHSVSWAAFVDICNNDSLVLFFEVIEPMEALINDKYNYQPFHGMMCELAEIYTNVSERTKAHAKPSVYLGD